MKDIHQKDVKQLLFDNQELIEENRTQFEKYKLMTELISKIQSEIEPKDKKDDDSNNSDEEIETTSTLEIEDFNNWARNQASKDISNFKHLTDLCDMNKLRSTISTLNQQQRRLFDDFTQRMVSTDVD